MLNNYFLLYHSADYTPQKGDLLLNFKDEEFDKIAALILSLRSDKLASYLELEEFKKLCKRVVLNGFLDTSTLYEFCYRVLQRVTDKPSLASEYIDVFNYLHSQSLLSEQERLKLTTIFEPLTFNTLHVDKDQNSFLANREALLSLLPQVTSLLESDALLKEIDSLRNYIHEQRFSIGITGVMNVGKSTFINALLSQELLGSSVVAETANLSVIRYSQRPLTKVRFFNRLEFDEMLHTFSDDEEREDYISKIEESLDINTYVKEESLTKEIERTQLYKYTSASDSSGLSHLVKDVELGVDLEFLKGSIEIVDTPGLDDSLIVRESVTQGYVANCDLLIHLMNVNQSATQKDVDFIIDAVLNQNVSSILILLTKADNITQKELSEVIEYTKTTIENQLASIDGNKSASKLLSSIKFLSISAKTALDIRKVHQEEKQKGSIERSGILDVERYLYERLSSNSSKNEMIIERSTRKLLGIIKSQIKLYEYNLLLYSKDENELESELEKFNKTKEEKNSTCRHIDSQISLEYTGFEDFLDNLDSNIESSVSSLRSMLMNRVVDEITYTLKNDKTELKDIQLKMIIDKSLNHGFVDILREHKHGVEKKIESIRKNIEISFKDHHIAVNDLKDSFSMSALFEKSSNSVLATSSKMILQQTIKLTKGIKLSKVDLFKEKYAELLDEEFVYVSSHLRATQKELNKSVSKAFFDALRAPIESLKEEFLEYESSLEKQIFLLKDRDKDVEELQIETQHKINSLAAIAESIS